MCADESSFDATSDRQRPPKKIEVWVGIEPLATISIPMTDTDADADADADADRPIDPMIATRRSEAKPRERVPRHGDVATAC